jgi:hypothetical protein
LLSAADQVQLLVAPAAVDLFQTLFIAADRLRRLTVRAIGASRAAADVVRDQGVTLLADGIAEVASVLNMFRDACVGMSLRTRVRVLGLTPTHADGVAPKFAVQNVLRNLNAHAAALEILQRPSDDTSSTLLEAALEFLEAVCWSALRLFEWLTVDRQQFLRGNTENQNKLFRHRQLILDCAVQGRQAAMRALTELVRDNRTVCHQLSDGFIGHCIEMADKPVARPDILRFLQAVVMVEGRPMERNQELVLKLLLHRPGTLRLSEEDFAAACVTVCLSCRFAGRCV